MNYKNKDSELFWIWGSYHNELVKLKPYIDFTKDNQWNRTYIRALMSMIEGIAYRIRQVLLERDERNEINITAEEKIVLKEKQLELDKQGHIKEIDKFYKFELMFRFTFRTYAKYYDKMNIYENYISNHNYENFKDVIIYRNRISHPKNAKDTFIGAEETKIADKAHEWFHKFILDLFEGDLLETASTEKKVKY